MQHKADINFMEVQDEVFMRVESGNRNDSVENAWSKEKYLVMHSK